LYPSTPLLKQLTELIPVQGLKFGFRIVQNNFAKLSCGTNLGILLK
jgi:hypothetical protein